MQSRMRSKNIWTMIQKSLTSLCEFMHDMGNSMGGLGTYMHLIDKYDMYHGDLSGDFIDQALYVKRMKLRERSAPLWWETLMTDLPIIDFQEMELYLQTVWRSRLCRK